MNFKIWLENQENIKFLGWINDGRIIVSIHNKRYVYLTDAIHHRQLKKMSIYKPFAALNEIKKMIESGIAKQIEPPPTEKPAPVNSIKQQTLF
jgi:hypothetical protein